MEGSQTRRSGLGLLCSGSLPATTRHFHPVGQFVNDCSVVRIVQISTCFGFRFPPVRGSAHGAPRDVCLREQPQPVPRIIYGMGSCLVFLPMATAASTGMSWCCQ